MKKLVLPLTLLILACWAALQPLEILTFSASFMTMRKALTPLLGALALGWMGVSMLLALRPLWLERQLGGLDKLFRVHKWVGIGAVLWVAAHWLLILSPRTLMEWGWIEGLARRQHHGHGQGGESLLGLAKEMGEWSAWLMIVVGIVALLRFVPYGWFRKLHKAFPMAYLLGAFHSVMLLPDGSLASPFGLLTAAIAVGGGAIAVWSLAGMIGHDRRHAGKVISVVTTESGLVDLQVNPGREWPGHSAGQFALLTLDRKEGPHPFTIVSDWQAGGMLRFAIKPLGDYTRTLAGRVKPGDAVVIEGPYGCFDFGDATEEQVWVAGGIGITPFIARLEALAAQGGAAGKVHLFYCVANANDARFPGGLEDLCARAGVNLHKRIDSRDGLTGADEIGPFLAKMSSVWFCGPAQWGTILREALQRRFGLAPQRFHRELFEFR